MRGLIRLSLYECEMGEEEAFEEIGNGGIDESGREGRGVFVGS